MAKAALVAQWQCDIVDDVHTGEQVEALKDKADLLRADTSTRAMTDLGDRASGKRVVTVARRVEQAEDI